jgi:hypothetical protein
MMDETVESLRAGLFPRTDVTAAEPSKPGLELLIGSNIFRNTNGVVKIHGKEQLVLESKREQGLLLLTIDLYGEGGTHIAHLRRNVLALNQAGQFTIEIHRAQNDSLTDAPWVRLSDQQSGEIVLEARVASENKIQITSGKFYSHKGTLVEITPHYCRIGSGMTLFGDIAENRGGMVVLG